MAWCSSSVAPAPGFIAEVADASNADVAGCTEIELEAEAVRRRGFSARSAHQDTYWRAASCTDKWFAVEATDSIKRTHVHYCCLSGNPPCVTRVSSDA